jgi:hypothetical protein
MTVLRGLSNDPAQQDWRCGGCGSPSHEPAPNELITCPKCGIHGVTLRQPERLYLRRKGPFGKPQPEPPALRVWTPDDRRCSPLIQGLPAKSKRRPDLEDYDSRIY